LNLYLDTSALIKRYAREAGATELRTLVTGADLLATAKITYVEMAAAFARAIRIGSASCNWATRGLAQFQNDWLRLLQIDLTEPVTNRAALLAWNLSLRGYDAVHLASALVWQIELGEMVTLATYDQQLWKATQQTGVAVFPQDLANLPPN
jgi:predicted nucleic acid-binding protein